LSKHLDGSPKPVTPLWYVATAWLRIRCACGHATSVQLSDLIARGINRETRCYEVIGRLRCTECGERPAEADVGWERGLPGGTR
jgi:hypothetical protein